MRPSVSGSVRPSDLYEEVGGLKGCRSLSRRFHERVEQDPVLRSMFPKSMLTLSEHFALFLGEHLGGPEEYRAKRGKQSLLCRHAHRSISTGEAERWLNQMFAAIDDVGIDEAAGERLRDLLVRTAKTLTDPFIPFYALPPDILRRKIKEEPELLQSSQMGHSLLREAVGRWDAPRVHLLLECGANANSEERTAHSPLYRAVNASIHGSEAEGEEVVKLLIRGGADVNHQSGPGKSTPLHVAARRGHVGLAEILLTAGADIERKDAKGATPLGRAINCRKGQMVAFLLSRGANP